MILLTSILPSTDKKIIDSWLQIGKVYSLNCQKEIDVIKGQFFEDKFPQVNFIVDEKIELNRQIWGRPLVPITSFFQFAQTLPEEEVITIINSDIFIQYDKELFEQIIKLVKEGNFVIGKRWNYTVTFSDAVQEIWGVDFFVMNQKLLKQLPTDSPFHLGGTWWDYWLPTVIKKLDVPIYKLEHKMLYHKKHPVKWSQESWHTMGKHFYKEMGLKCKNLSYIDGMKVYHDFYDTAITIA